MRTRTFNTDTRTGRTLRTLPRRDEPCTSEAERVETTKVCLFKLWEAERREAAN